MISPHFLVVLLILGSSSYAKKCEDICGKEEEPTSILTNRNRLTECTEEDDLKTTR